MQCQTTLDELRSFLSSDESETSASQSLRVHIDDCTECRSRLDWLTHDGSLATATRQRRMNIGDHLDSEDLKQALDTVDSMIQQGSEQTVGDYPVRSDADDAARLLDPADPGSDQPGTLGMIGRYQAQAVLGRGGMSVVFAAWDPVLDRRVAIKVLNSHRNARTWQRFAREARAAARIEHDAVVPLYEVVEREHGPPALVMPLMSAGTLQKELERGAVAPTRAAEITARIAVGLAEVHRHNQIHRDIKPGNILFDDNGVAKLGDFSLVRRDEDEPLTQDNVLPGTPEFIAPEMLSGGTADVRSDVYQLGLTLYAMLTGAPPFRGTVRSILRQIVEDSPPSLSQHRNRNLRSKIPPDLETICMKAIERDPGDRYENATQLAEDLQCFLSGEPISARRPGIVSRAFRTTRRHPVKVAVAAVVAPCLLLLGIAYAAIQNQHQLHVQKTRLIHAEREVDLKRLADETHRANLAELKSSQALSQSFSTVLSAQQVREPNWIDGEKTIKSALLGGLEQGFEQMLLSPQRNPNLAEMSLTIAKLRDEVGKTSEARDAYDQAIKELQTRIDIEPTEMLWQHMVNARRGYGRTSKDLEKYDQAIEHLEVACNLAQRHANANLDSLKWKLEWAMSETELGLALISAGKGSESDTHLDSAAIRIRVIATAERPEVDVVGFGTLFGDAASNLADAFGRRKRFDHAVAIQRVAVAQAELLGDDELSNVKRSVAYADSAILLVQSNRVPAALRALRRAIDSLDTAIRQSNTPSRYRQRRALLKNHQERLFGRTIATRASANDRES